MKNQIVKTHIKSGKRVKGYLRIKVRPQKESIFEKY